METPGERLQCGPPVQLNDDEQQQSCTPSDSEEGEGDMAGGGDDEAPQPMPTPPAPPRTATSMKRGRPIGNKCAKDEERQRIHREHVARAQRRVSAEMASANRAKAQVLEDQSALHIFTMPVSETFSDKAREYLALRHEEELIKIRLRVAERKAALAREEAARKKAEGIAAREHAAHEEEIQAALSRRNPPTAPPRGAPRRNAAGPQSQPPAPTLAPRSGSRAPTASAAASSTAPVRPLHPASPVSDQQQEDVGDGESQQFQGDDNFLPDLSQRPPHFEDGQSNLHPTQESEVSETQPKYMSAPATSRLFASITSRHQQLSPPGAFLFS
jgi:hypothetical protein